MKITKTYLKQLIREALEDEGFFDFFKKDRGQKRKRMATSMGYRDGQTLRTGLKPNPEYVHIEGDKGDVYLDIVYRDHGEYKPGAYIVVRNKNLPNQRGYGRNPDEVGIQDEIGPFDNVHDALLYPGGGSIDSPKSQNSIFLYPGQALYQGTGTGQYSDYDRKFLEDPNLDQLRPPYTLVKPDPE